MTDAGESLWRKVFKCPIESFEDDNICHCFRQAKIDDDDLKEQELFDQKILRLKIAVCYSLYMKVTKTVQYLPKSGEILAIRDIGLLYCCT